MVFQTTPLTILLAAITQSSLLTIAHATCSTFTPLNYSGLYSYPQDPQQLTRITPVYNCTGSLVGSTGADGFPSNCASNECGVSTTDHYYVKLNATLNVTVPSGEYQNLLNLIKQDATTLASSDLGPGTYVDLNATMIHDVPGRAGQCIAQGASAYGTFTPSYRCVKGVLSGCTGDVTTLDNQELQACGLVVSDGDYVSTLTFVTVNGTNPAPALTKNETGQHSSAALRSRDPRYHLGHSLSWSIGLGSLLLL